MTISINDGLTFCFIWIACSSIMSKDIKKGRAKQNVIHESLNTTTHNNNNSIQLIKSFNTSNKPASLSNNNLYNKLKSSRNLINNSSNNSSIASTSEYSLFNITSIPINCSSRKKDDIKNCWDLANKLNEISTGINNSNVNNTQPLFNRTNNFSVSNDTSLPKYNSSMIMSLTNSSANQKTNNSIHQAVSLELRNKTHLNDVFLNEVKNLNNSHNIESKQTEQKRRKKFEIPKFGLANFTGGLISKNFSVSNVFNNTVKDINGFIDNFNMSSPVESVTAFYLNETKKRNESQSANRTEGKSVFDTTSGENSVNLRIGDMGKNDFGNNSESRVNQDVNTNKTTLNETLTNSTNETLTNSTNLVNSALKNTSGSSNSSFNLKLLNDTEGINRNEVSKNIGDDHLNHSSVSSFTGEISKVETGTVGKLTTNGSKQVSMYNETDNLFMNNDTFQYSNLTSQRNCSGCFKEGVSLKKDDSTEKTKNNTKSESVKKCKIQKSNEFKEDMKDMSMTEDDFDVAASNTNCAKKSMIKNRNKLITLFKRRLISNHVSQKNSSNVTTKNQKVDEKIEEEKNKERQQTNVERAQSNEERSQELKKLKYKILNGIHDTPADENPVPEERGVVNRTIPVDPSMLPKYTEPLTEDNRDALEGVMGIDSRPAIENTTSDNSSVHTVPVNRSEKPLVENITKSREENILTNKVLGENENKNKDFKETIIEPAVQKTYESKESQVLVNKPTVNPDDRKESKILVNKQQAALENLNKFKNLTIKNITKQEKDNKNMKLKSTASLHIPTVNNTSESTEHRHPIEQGETMKKSILCFGDSLTKGFYNNGESYRPYSIKLKEMLEDNDKNTDYQIDTEAVNGECAFSGMKKRLPVLLNETFPLDLVIILGGTNDLLLHDCNKDLDLYQELKDLHEMCHKRGIKTAMVTIPEMIVSKDGTGKMKKKDFNEAWGTVNQKLRVYAYSNKHPKMVILVDLADEFSRQNLKDDPAEFWDDNIHPNANGYDKIGEIIYNDIKGNF